MTKVSEIYYGSPAEKNGLAVGDEIIAVNEMQVKVNMAEWISYFAEQAIEIIVASGGKIKTIQLIKNSSTYFANPRVLRKENSSNLEIAAWESWSGKSY